MDNSGMSAMTEKGALDAAIAALQTRVKDRDAEIARLTAERDAAVAEISTTMTMRLTAERDAALQLHHKACVEAVEFRRQRDAMRETLTEIVRVGSWNGTDDHHYNSKECRLAKGALAKACQQRGPSDG